MTDETDRLLIEALRRDARASLKELGNTVGLSSPSVAERIRRLQDRGVITGFSVDVDPVALGYPLEAIVRIRPLPGKLHIVRELIEQTPQIVECDKVTGDDCYVARLFVRSMDEIDTILDRISDKASTSTSMIKSKTVARRHPPLI